MRLPSRFLLLLLLAGFPASRGEAQLRVAQVKSAPQDYRGRAIQLEGEVVEVRGISPRMANGVYRLVDESDPTGVLIRTKRLPDNGGPFRVEARLSPELLQNGALLLDETDRDLDRSPLGPIALLIGLLGLAGGGVAFGLYLKARRTERHMRLGPPMWLIPTGHDEGGTSTGEGEPPPPVHFNYRLHYVEQERSVLLERRKRNWLALAAGGTIIGCAGAGLLLALRQDDLAKPAFVLTTPGGDRAVAPVDTVAHADTATLGRRTDDTLRVGLAAPFATDSMPQAVRDSLRRRRAAWRDSVRQVRESLAAAATPPRETTVTKLEQPAPVVEQLPPPAPTPVPPRRDTAISEPKPRPDPEAVRRAAARELDGGMQRFVAATVAKQVGTVAGLYPAAGDVKRRERFLNFLRTAAPGATLRGADQPAVDETSAESPFTLAFQWRGDFGVERRKDVHFAATARRSGEAWVFDGVRLLEAFP
jgi:hypothetical protein